MIIVNGINGPYGDYMKGAYGANAFINIERAFAQGYAPLINGIRYSDSTDSSKLVENTFGFGQLLFNEWDKDNNGKITRGEYPTPSNFLTMDLNNDGNIDKAEMAASSLAQDKNKDGILDSREVNSIPTKMDSQAAMDQYKLQDAAIEFATPKTLTTDQESAVSKFTVKTEFGSSSFGLLANNSISKDDAKAIHPEFWTDDRLNTFFNAADLNNDGKINAAEDAAFTIAVDTNHNGAYDAQEINTFDSKTAADDSDPKAIVQAASDKYDIPGQVKTQQDAQLQKVLLALLSRLFGIPLGNFGA